MILHLPEAKCIFLKKNKYCLLTCSGHMLADEDREGRNKSHTSDSCFSGVYQSVRKYVEGCCSKGIRCKGGTHGHRSTPQRDRDQRVRRQKAGIHPLRCQAVSPPSHTVHLPLTSSCSHSGVFFRDCLDEIRKNTVDALPSLTHWKGSW